MALTNIFMSIITIPDNYANIVGCIWIPGDDRYILCNSCPPVPKIDADLSHFVGELYKTLHAAVRSRDHCHNIYSIIL